MKYFNTKTGALLDDQEQRLEVEAQLAQRQPLHEVIGTALEVVEAGRESVDVGDYSPVVDPHRPEAVESSSEAQDAFEEEEEARQAAQEENTALAGAADVDREPDEEPQDGELGENADGPEGAPAEVGEPATEESRAENERAGDRRQSRREEAEEHERRSKAAKKAAKTRKENAN